MEDVIYCTVCLIAEVKMFRLDSVLYDTYKNLIPRQNHLDHRQVHACYECAHLLQKYGEFKAKCHSAYLLLQEYTAGSFQISDELLKSIDRKQYKLESRLKVEQPDTILEVNTSDETHSTPPTHSNYGGPNQDVSINPLENPLQIDPAQIKEELIEDRKPYGNMLHTVPIEIINPDSFDGIPNKDNTDNTPEIFNITLKTENNTACKNEKHSESSDISSESSDNGIDNYSVDSDDSNDVGASDAGTDDDNSDLDSDSDEVISKSLNKLLAKYPVDEVKTEEVALSPPPKRKCTSNDGNETPVKKKKKSVPVNVVRIINEILKVPPAKQKVESKPKKTKKEFDFKKDFDFSFNKSFYDNYATVITLTPEDAVREVLLRKESRNYKLSKYKCELCYRGYRLESTFRTHMQKHTEEEGPLKCDICQQRFGVKKQLSNHIKMCHTYKFICQICPYTCYSVEQSKTHVYSHKGKQYSCKECGMKFKFPNSVSSHQRKKHKLEVVCDLCGSVFAVQKGLNAHKKKIHKREKNEMLGPTCEECNVHFSNETAWKRHLVLCTKHRVENGCEICGESFNDFMSLREHSLKHEKKIQKHYRKNKVIDQEYKKEVLGPCVYCNVPLITMREYKNHMMKYHPDTEHAEKIRFQITNKCVCEVCGMMFKLPCFLKLHQRSHTGERPFECDKCDKKFASKHTLQAHQAFHTNVYPHKCHICGKSYGNKSSLTKHIKYHTERPFKCPSCEKSFAYLCEMRNHVKYVHNKVPWPKRDRSKRNLVEKERRL